MISIKLITTKVSDNVDKLSIITMEQCESEL